MKTLRHDRGVGADHLGREPYPVRDRVRRVTIRAAAGMFAHAGQHCDGSDGGARATPGRGRWGCSVDVAAAVRFRISNRKPAADCSARALNSLDVDGSPANLKASEAAACGVAIMRAID